MSFEVVAAMDRKRGIGKNGQLPWRLPTDMAFFMRLTREAPAGKSNAVIMGRKTWDSIPKKFQPLPERTNIVLTRQSGLALPPGVVAVTRFADALAVAGKSHMSFVIGGGELYRLALADPACTVIHLTVIDGVFDCDAFFPELPPRFVLRETSPPVTENGVSFVFQRWVSAS